MADTKPSHTGAIPVEGDGIHYRGILWFVVVLVVTTLAAQGLMVVAFKFLARDVIAGDAPREPLAAPIGQLPPKPNLLYLDSNVPALRLGEPSNFEQFREAEDKALTTYGWIDQGAGVVRIPIDRAKVLLLQHGLPSRDTAAPALPATGAPPAKAGQDGKGKNDKTDHPRGPAGHEG